MQRLEVSGAVCLSPTQILLPTPAQHPTKSLKVYVVILIILGAHDPLRSSREHAHKV